MQVPDFITKQYGLIPYFDERNAPEPVREYVGWIDIMGMANTMSRSLPVSGNFVMKLLVAAEDFKETSQPVGLCAVIDGVFLHSNDQIAILNALKHTLGRLAMVHISTAEAKLRFLVRAGLAYGPMIVGKNIDEASFRPSTYKAHEPTRPKSADSVVFGIAVSEAHRAAQQAPPFGVRLHESVRAFGPNGAFPLPATLWQWWLYHPTDADKELAKYLKAYINDYFAWCKCRPITTQYDTEDLARHETQFNEYFIDVENVRCPDPSI